MNSSNAPLYLIIAFIFLSSVWAVWPSVKSWWKNNTPEGYEDETGFHTGKDPRNEQK
jgi:hypothetical protein